MAQEINLSAIAQQLSLTLSNVEKTVALLDGGATIPFISRYRKELTGGMDEVQIQQLQDAVTSARELEKRRAFILKSIDEQGKLEAPLKSKIENAKTLTELEDIYLPYKPKRRTKATMLKRKVWSHWQHKYSKEITLTHRRLSMKKKKLPIKSKRFRGLGIS